MVQDAKKANFYAPATRKVFVKLSDEDRGPGEERTCGLLQKSLYGTWGMAHNWAVAYTAVLDKLGFEKGATFPCSFLHRCRGIKMAVHSDDFIRIAQRKGLGRIRHLHTQSLWVQDAVREQRVFLDKVSGADNLADMYTTHLDAQT